MVMLFKNSYWIVTHLPKTKEYYYPYLINAFDGIQLAVVLLLRSTNTVTDD